MLSGEELRKLAKLSRLEVDEQESEVLRSRLGQMLLHMEELKSLDLKSVEPMTCVTESSAGLRPDIEGNSLPQDRAFANAPKVEQGHFVIPKVIG